VTYASLFGIFFHVYVEEGFEEKHRSPWSMISLVIIQLHEAIHMFFRWMNIITTQMRKIIKQGLGKRSQIEVSGL